MAIKKKFIKGVVKVACLLVYSMLEITAAFAATHYVSNSGSASWTESKNIETPTSMSTALVNAVAGDTIYLRGGTYTLPASPEKCNGTGLTSVYVPENSGTAGLPITFQAYETETVFFDNSANIGVGCDVAAYGAWGNNYIIWDGINTNAITNKQGRAVTIHNSNNITLKNAELKGVTADSNNSTLRIEDSTNITIQNNKMWNVYGTSDTTNPSAIELYDSSKILIDHNDLYNCQNGIYVKHNVQNIVIRFNYIANISNVGVRINPKWPYMANVEIYQNIIDGATAIGDSSQSGDQGGYADIFIIYNNTLYVTYDGFKTDPTGGASDYRNISFFNNIVYNSGSGKYFLRLSSINQDAFVDHNIFYNTGGQWVEVSKQYSSLSSWQASSSYDVNSTVSDPNFLNASGSFNLRTDFKRLSYSKDGRGGDYSDVIGAYITGNEYIGYTAGISQPAAPLEFKNE